MKYFSELKRAMEWLATKPDTLFPPTDNQPSELFNKLHFIVRIPNSLVEIGTEQIPLGLPQVVCPLTLLPADFEKNG